MSVLVLSTHRLHGASAAVVVLGGIMTYLPGGVLFAAALATALSHLGLAASFLVSTAILVVTNQGVKALQSRHSRLSVAAPLAG